MENRLNNKKTDALIRLLEDPDDHVHEAVTRELLRLSPRIVPLLEKIWESTYDDRFRIRIENLIQRLYFKESYKTFTRWSKMKEPDLLEGFILASKYHFPDISKDWIERRMEEIRIKVWVELNNSLTSLEKISVLNHVFFHDFGFTLDLENIYHPKNCFINQILENRKGNKISIALLYTIVARSLGLSVAYVDIPKYPLLAYTDKRIAAKIHPSGVETDVLFYINASNNGSITGRRELEFQLRRSGLELCRQYFEPDSNLTFLSRLLEVTEKSYELNGFREKTAGIHQIISVLNVGKQKKLP
jgi:regulator of sirC expression with transglutaminase-like and TPR domain